VSTKVITIGELVDGGDIDLTDVSYGLPKNMHLFGIVGGSTLSSTLKWGRLNLRDGSSSSIDIFSFDISSGTFSSTSSYSSFLEEDSYVRISDGLIMNFVLEASTDLTGGWATVIYQ